ncbi:MAG: hypothetical protein L6R35_000196 [Caloplaca aegaea]|nr:MAG: hypothetical protein L6R35_000196 [Caloplaca aegaea]
MYQAYAVRPVGAQVLFNPGGFFGQDAIAIVASLRDFFANYLYTYYPTRDLPTSDREIQDWIAEANGAARVLDFPSAPLDRRTTLIDVLTHIAYFTGVSHHALNSNAPTGTLPLSPLRLLQTYSRRQRRF